MKEKNMEGKTVSVVTPTYNSEKYLRQTMESVWSGSTPDEQIIVDANSKDATREIVKEFISKGFPIKIISRKAQGISDAMNYGIQNSSGSIIHVLHSDDYNVDEQIYDKVRELFATNDCMWLYGYLKTIDEDGGEVGIQPIKFGNKYAYWKMCLINYIPHTSLFIKKEMFETYGYFDTNLKIVMDWDFWLRIGRQHKPLVVDEIWGVARLHSESLSTKEAFSKKINQEIRKIFSLHFNKINGYFIYVLYYCIALLRHIKKEK